MLCSIELHWTGAYVHGIICLFSTIPTMCPLKSFSSQSSATGLPVCVQGVAAAHGSD